MRIIGLTQRIHFGNVSSAPQFLHLITSFALNMDSLFKALTAVFPQTGHLFISCASPYMTSFYQLVGKRLTLFLCLQPGGYLKFFSKLARSLAFCLVNGLFHNEQNKVDYLIGNSFFGAAWNWNKDIPAPDRCQELKTRGPEFRRTDYRLRRPKTRPNLDSPPPPLGITFYKKNALMIMAGIGFWPAAGRRARPERLPGSSRGDGPGHRSVAI